MVRRSLLAEVSCDAPGILILVFVWGGPVWTGVASRGKGRSLRLPKGRQTPEVCADQIYSRMVYSKLSSVLCTSTYRAVCATVVCYPPPHCSNQGGRGDGRG